MLTRQALPDELSPQLLGAFSPSARTWCEQPEMKSVDEKQAAPHPRYKVLGSLLHWKLEGSPFRNTTLCGYVFKNVHQYPGRAGGMYGVLGL